MSRVRFLLVCVGMVFFASFSRLLSRFLLLCSHCSPLEAVEAAILAILVLITGVWHDYLGVMLLFYYCSDVCCVAFVPFGCNRRSLSASLIMLFCRPECVIPLC